MVRVQDGGLERFGPQSSPGRSFQAAGQEPRNRHTERRAKRTANAKACAEPDAQKEKKRARRSSPSRSPPRSYRDRPELARPKDIRRPEDKPRKVPEAEWKAMIAAKGDKDACRFWNSSCGCQNKACEFRHVCLPCGREWVNPLHQFCASFHPLPPRLLEHAVHQLANLLFHCLLLPLLWNSFLQVTQVLEMLRQTCAILWSSLPLVPR